MVDYFAEMLASADVTVEISRDVVEDEADPNGFQRWKSGQKLTIVARRTLGNFIHIMVRLVP